MNKAQKQLASDLRALAYIVGRLCDKHASNPLHVNLQNAWRDLEEVCSRQEKEHMAFGARLLNHRPARKSTHATRVYYFMCKAVFQDRENGRGPCIKNAVDAYTTRQDFVIGEAIRMALDSALTHTPEGTETHGLREYLVALGNGPLVQALETCDYARDLA